jgi:MoxR-like ATPase
VFLDEIFKSNSAILNSLLTIINEKKFYQDGVPQPVRLKILFAATNEIPEHTELGALKDRFCLKAACRSVQDDHFVDLLDMGLRMQAFRDTNQKPWAEGHASLTDFLKANRYLTLMMAREEPGPGGEPITDRHLFFKDELLRELRRVLKTLVREDNVFVSDRKIIKLYRLLRTRAWVLHGGTVEREDLSLLSFLGETKDEIDLLETKVPQLLGLSTSG